MAQTEAQKAYGKRRTNRERAQRAPEAGNGFFRVIGFDLETTSLSGMIGRVLACSFIDIGATDADDKVWTLRGDDPEFRHEDPINDQKLVAAIRDNCELADIIVGHNSKLFDIKFLNARLIHWNERPYIPGWSLDSMWVVRSALRTSSKLDNVQKHLGLPESKTPVDWDTWARAQAGYRKAMDEVVVHCEQDVKVLAQAMRRLKPYVRNIRRG